MNKEKRERGKEKRRKKAEDTRDALAVSTSAFLKVLL